MKTPTLFRTFTIAVLFTLVAGAHTWAETQDAATEGGLVPLNIQVNISRYDGDVVISSLPYMLSVTADERPRESRLNIGADMKGSTVCSLSHLTAERWGSRKSVAIQMTVCAFNPAR